MPRIAADRTRHNINLRRGDYEFLKTYCLDKEANASDMIRATVSKLVDAIKAAQSKANASAGATPEVDIDV